MRQLATAACSSRARMYWIVVKAMHGYIEKKSGSFLVTSLSEI